MKVRKINLDMLYNNESIEIDLKRFADMILGGASKTTYRYYQFRLKIFFGYKIINNDTIKEWDTIINSNKHWNNNTKNDTASALRWLLRKINMIINCSCFFFKKMFLKQIN